jgi:IS66 Orf2 like protein
MIAANVQVWVATTPVDMRKSFDALAEVVRAFLGRDPHSGSLFVFRNKSGHLVKILWWESTGWGGNPPVGRSTTGGSSRACFTSPPMGPRRWRFPTPSS